MSSTSADATGGGDRDHLVRPRPRKPLQQLSHLSQASNASDLNYGGGLEIPENGHGDVTGTTR